MISNMLKSLGEGCDQVDFILSDIRKFIKTNIPNIETYEKDCEAKKQELEAVKKELEELKKTKE